MPWYAARAGAERERRFRIIDLGFQICGKSHRNAHAHAHLIWFAIGSSIGVAGLHEHLGVEEAEAPVGGEDEPSAGGKARPAPVAFS